MWQLTDAVQFLHSVSVMHRDLKPTNCLVFGKITKLCDFGLAKNVGPESPDSNTLDVGTEYYRAPEVKTKYSFSADVFSLGGVFLELVLYGRKSAVLPNYLELYNNNTTLEDIATTLKIDDLMENGPSKEVCTCVLLMLSKTESVRPTLFSVRSTLAKVLGLQTYTNVELEQQAGQHREQRIVQLKAERDDARRRAREAQELEQKKIAELIELGFHE
jgi:serine/threonine protein kinase